jgi:hypothetical protein
MRSRFLIAAAALGLFVPAGAVLAQDNTSSNQDRQQHTSTTTPSKSMPPAASSTTSSTTSSETAASSTTASTGPTTSSPTTATEPTSTEVTTVTGTVKSYDAGRSITITRPDGTTVSYTITQESAVPSKLENGKTVVIRTKNQNGQQTVERITYSSSRTPKS